MKLGARFYEPGIGRFISQDSYLGEPGTPPSLHRYLYAYSNPTVYIDLFGYEAIGGEELSLYYEPSDMVPNKGSLNFSKKFSETRPPRYYAGKTDIEKEVLKELYREFGKYQVNRRNSFYHAFILVEDGQGETDAKKEALDYLGSGFQHQYKNNKELRASFDARFADAQRGDIVCISDFWTKSVLETIDRADNTSGRIFKGIPVYDQVNLNAIVMNDELAPPSFSRSAAISTYVDLALTVGPVFLEGAKAGIGFAKTAGRTYEVGEIMSNGRIAGMGPGAAWEGELAIGRNVSLIPEEYISYKTIIDMRAAPGKAVNAAGFPRNGPWYWRQALKHNPEIFSATNKAAIRAGRSPIVDELWIKYNPSHQSFAGEKLVHHHVGQGAYAAGVPESVHQSWHKILHPN